MASTIAQHERTILRVALGVLVLAFLLYIVTISTPFWVWVTVPEGYNRTFDDGSRKLIVQHHAGLWRICRVEQKGDTRGESCRNDVILVVWNKFEQGMQNVMKSLYY